MSGLVIKLGPKERILVNGAVIENGDRRSRFTVLSSKANILRLKDAIHPDEANSPVKRACCLAQLILSGDIGFAEASPKLARQIEILDTVFQRPDVKQELNVASQELDRENAYGCLRALRKILPLEERLLSMDQR